MSRISATEDAGSHRWVLSGMLFCADCGAKLYQVRARGWTHEQEHFVCATYRKQKGKCTSHQIRNVQVEQILLTEINRMLAFVRERESEFVELLTKKNERDLNRQFRECSRELEQATQRITKLDSIIQRLYEDNLDGKISDERFAKMTATYEQEQKDLQARVIVLRETLSKAKAQRLNIDSFLAQVKKYTEARNWMQKSSEPWWSVSMYSHRRRCQVPERKSRPSLFIGTSLEQSNCPRNRKNRHSRITPNYADIFPRN